MTISVIIPVHNSELYLDECLNSVLPGLQADDEIILVENGSKDRSWDLCLEYEKKYNNVRAARLEEAGVSRARNYGITMAEKYWVVFLDSDDIMAPSFMETAHLAASDADLVMYDYCYLGEEPEYTAYKEAEYTEVSPDLLKRGTLQFGKYQKQLRKDANLDNITIWSACGKLISRDLLVQNHIKFPEALCFSEDTAFALQFYSCAEKIVFCPQYAFFYRQTPGSTSRTTNPRTLENNRYLRRWTYAYVRKKGIYGDLKEEVSAFLSRKFIEECLFLKETEEDKDSRIHYVEENAEKPYMKKAIKHTQYAHLIAGKRNSLQYGAALWLLKRKLYSLLFIGA